MMAALGVLFHFLGGFASGSFYMPYRNVKGWSWESMWIIGGLFSWLIIPPLAAFLTLPTFHNIISNTAPDTLVPTFMFGVLWGIGGLTYGLGVRYLGVALGSSIILGLCMVFGALVPAIYYDFFPSAGKDNLTEMFSSQWGKVILVGLLICIAGIIVCGTAGVRKEKELGASSFDGHGGQATSGTEYRFGLGIIVSLVSGLLSACFNFGLEAGQEMAAEATDQWRASTLSTGEFLFRNNVVYVVLLWGGLLTNLVWCLILNLRNNSWSDYINQGLPLRKNYLLAAIAGTTWFLQFFFYGMGESKLGNGPSSWILHMAFIILVANMWGIYSGEWNQLTSRTKRLNFTGIAIIILSVLVVGYGNSLHN